MKILIINVFSTANKGDAAIALSQIEAIRACVPEAEITVQSWNPEVDDKALPCPVIGPFFQIVSAIHPDWPKLRQHAHTAGIALNTLLAASPGLGRLTRGTLSPRLRNLVNQYGDSDLIVSVGGNFLYAYPGENSFSYLKHCHQILMAQRMRKPTILLAQSLGPVSTKLHRSLLRRIVNGASRVALRETLSQTFLKDLETRSDHITITPDTAFLLTPRDSRAAEAALAGFGVPPDGVRIGITVRDWSYPGSENAEQKSAEYPTIIAKLSDWMADTWGAHTVLLPQCISADQDDRKCMARVAQHVTRPSNLTVINDDIPPDLLKAICGQLDMFIGTRMHSNIFATAMSTPTLAISYQPKTDGIMKMLGMEQWTIRVAELTFQNLRERAESLWQERTRVKSQLAARVAEIQSQARADLAALLEPFIKSDRSSAEKPASRTR